MDNDKLEAPVRRFTGSEWRAEIASDPVMQFVKSVGDKSQQRDEWKDNPHLSLSNAFSDQYRAYLLNKYGGGIVIEGFWWPLKEADPSTHFYITTE